MNGSGKTTLLQSIQKRLIATIEEIETHLHLSLQKKILKILTNFFPKIQFIVSTHSPFVVMSVSNAVVFDLETSVFLKDAYLYSYPALVESYFEIQKGYSEKVELFIQEYSQLIEKEIATRNLSKEEESRQLELERVLDKASPLLEPSLYRKYYEAKKEPAYRFEHRGFISFKKDILRNEMDILSSL